MISEHTEKSVQQNHRRNPLNRFGSFGMDPLGMSPFAQPDRNVKETTRQTIVMAKIAEEFRVKQNEPLTIGIRRKVETENVAQDDQPSSVVVRGDSTFDAEQRWFDSAQLKGSRDVEVDGDRRELEINYSFKRVSNEEIVAERKAKAEKLAAAKKRDDERMKKKKLKTTELDALSSESGGLSLYDPEK